jgi:hypothetical protein
VSAFKNRLVPVVVRLKASFGARLGATPTEDPARLREGVERHRRELAKLRNQVAGEREKLEALRATLGEARRETFKSNVLGVGEPVFFLTGRAKSGTSWLMRILDSHPEVLCRGEGLFFGRDYVREKGEERARPRRGSLYGAIADSEYIRTWVERSAWTDRENIEQYLAGITGLATEYFLKRALAESGKKIVGDKTPFTGLQFVEEVATIRPDARLIHIIRDGRDVAISSVHHVWNNAKQEGGIHDLSAEDLHRREDYRADPQAFLDSGRSIFAPRMLAGTARNWAEMVNRAAHDGPKLLGDNYLETRYERLIETPEEEARRIFGFLGADVREDTVRRCVEAASFEKRAKGRARGQEDSKAFLRKGVAGDWKNVFNGEDRRIFKEAAGETLVRLGYEHGLNW